MKTFSQLIEENNKTLVILFDKMNPPTKVHEELIGETKHLAQRNNADHLIIASHNVDANKNPLTAESKLKHLQRAFPNTNLITTNKEKKSLLNYATSAYNKGYNHLIVTGDKTAKDHHDLLSSFNGVEGPHGYFKFNRISLKGNERMKSEDCNLEMRNAAKDNLFEKFKINLPSNIQSNHAFCRELFRDVRSAMGLNEDNHFKAIFATGGPNSGKDLIVRECIGTQRITEMNTVQAFLQLTKGSVPKEVENRMPLVINGPADDIDRISYIKEYLENLGYSTMMVFVDTTNEASKERNAKLSRMMTESIRHDKWTNAQKNKEIFMESFDNFMNFDNNGTLDALEEDIESTYHKINAFMGNRDYSKTAIDWLDSHGKLNINEKFNNFFKEEKNAKENSKTLQKINVKGKYNPEFRAARPEDIPADNRASDPNTDQIKWDSNKKRGTYTFKTYSEAKNPTLKISPPTKEPKFQQDNDKDKIKKRGDRSISKPGLGRPSGVGQEYDTRAGGQGAAAGAGLGNQTYSESQDYSNASPSSTALPGGSVQPNPLSNAYDGERKSFKYLRNKIKKEAIDDPGAVDMGVGGVMGGASNKEPMQSYKDQQRNIGLTIKKKKAQNV